MSNTQQLELENFVLPFGGKLTKKNRWIKLASIIPWEEFEEEYADQFSESGMGAPAKPFRMALGSILIKEKLQIIDQETVAQLQENPYLQFLIGFESYREEASFDSSMMVHFRKRISVEMLSSINERIHEEMVKKTAKCRRN